MGLTVTAGGVPLFSVTTAYTWTGTQTFNADKLVATSPHFVTNIKDTNGNVLMTLTATGSAVNGVTLANAATGNAPSLSATGSDTNINLSLTAKGSGYTVITHNRTAASVGDAAATTSTSLVMAGYGGTAKITPQSTGTIKIIFAGSYKSDTGTANIVVGGAYGTGTAPVQGAAATGTLFGNALKRAGTLNLVKDFVVMATVTGLTVGTAYWFDLQYDTDNGSDAAELKSVFVDIEEL